MSKTKPNNTKRLRQKNQQARQQADSKGASVKMSTGDTEGATKAKVRNQRGRAKGSHLTQKTTQSNSVKGRLQESYHEKADKVVSVHGHTMEKGDIFKIVGLGAFFVLMVILVIALWPMLKTLGEPDGLTKVIAEVQSAGAMGVLMLLGLQFLQIVVAFIPGEVVQVAAGMMYGPWWGALIIFLGCVISSMFIFELVHRLGAPFVQSMVPAKYMDKFRTFEKSGKLNFIVFLLFFIPGLPKDVFTYIVPLTDMPMKTFILLSCVARIPGIFVSTYAADSLIEGDITQSVIIFAVVGVIALVAILCRNKLMNALERFNKKDAAEEEQEQPKAAVSSDEPVEAGAQPSIHAKEAVESDFDSKTPVAAKPAVVVKPSTKPRTTSKGHV